MGLFTWNSSSINNRNQCVNKNQTCATMYIFTGKNKEKGILGKNIFAINLRGDGSLVPPKETSTQICKRGITDTELRPANGIACTDKIIKAGWKMNY